MRASVAFVLPFVVVSLVGLGTWGLMSWWPRTVGEPKDVSFEEINLDQDRYVRLRGTAHYRALLKERVPASLIRGGITLYAFGFFPEDDLNSRAIPVLVWTQRAPERRIEYEYLTIEGILSAPDDRNVPPGAEDILAAGGEHWFSDSLVVMEAVRIMSEDGEWIEP